MLETPEPVVCPLVAGDPVCPMTGTTTCTTDEAKQRQCPDC